MNRPQAGPSPRGTNLIAYATVGVAIAGALGFMFLLFGEIFLVALAVFSVVGGIGCLHYFLWGRAMTENAKKQAKAEIQSMEPE
jgi:hypothetical protein